MFMEDSLTGGEADASVRFKRFQIRISPLQSPGSGRFGAHFRDLEDKVGASALRGQSKGAMVASVGRMQRIAKHLQADLKQLVGIGIGRRKVRRKFQPNFDLEGLPLRLRDFYRGSY